MKEEPPTRRTHEPREAIAQHEATHAVVAVKLGLPVAWVSIEYGLEEGVRFQAAVKLATRNSTWSGTGQRPGRDGRTLVPRHLRRGRGQAGAAAYATSCKNASTALRVRVATLVSDLHVEIIDLAVR